MKKIETKKKRISYKSKYEKLQKTYNKLELENNTLKMFYKPTCADKIKIIEEYYMFCTNEGYDANSIHCFFEYKQKLQKEIKYE